MILGKTRIALSLALLGFSSAVMALPTGPTVGAGSATFTTSGGTLTIQNSNNAIINWQGFSIGAGETARFVQPSSSSAVLNRVVTANPSSIFGSLTSNGNVFLVNPNGIVFGAGSQVSAGGLTLSTSDITDANFLAGNYAFTGNGSGSISLDGSLVSPVWTIVAAHVLVVPILGVNTSVIDSSQVLGSGHSIVTTGVTLTTGSAGISVSGVASSSINSTGFGSSTGSLVAVNAGIVITRPILTATAAPTWSVVSFAALPNSSPTPRGVQSSMPVANLAAPGLTGSATVTSVALNFEKREVGF